MYTKFPFSMENLPRQKNFGCFSLKFGCIFSALLLILYSVLALAQCIALLTAMSTKNSKETTASYFMVISIGIIHCMTMFFTTVMLVGAIKDKYQLMKPWIVWTSCQIMASLLMFVFWTTMNMINHVENSLLTYLVDFLLILVRFYMLVLVSSYSKELEEEAGHIRLKWLALDESTYSAV